MLNIENDHLIFDGLESVRLIQAGTGRIQQINRALQFGVTAKDAIGSDGTYRQGDVKYNLPHVEAPAFPPVAGDWLKDAAGRVWTIGTVEDLTLKTRWQVWCKRVDLNENTSEELKIFRPVSKRDESGAAYTDWRLAKTTRGHINELASEIELTTGRRRLKITHQIFIVEAFEVEAGFRVVDCRGAAFNVSRVTKKGELGAATVLDVETARAPVAD